MEMIIIAVIAIAGLYLMSSRTRKQQRAAQEFRATLAPGQEVMTASGMFGTIVEIDEESDIVTIESTPGTKTRWLRAAVAKLVEPPVEESEEAEDETDVVVPDDLSGMITDGKGHRPKPVESPDEGTDSK